MSNRKQQDLTGWTVVYCREHKNSGTLIFDIYYNSDSHADAHRPPMAFHSMSPPVGSPFLMLGKWSRGNPDTPPFKDVNYIMALFDKEVR